MKAAIRYLALFPLLLLAFVLAAGAPSAFSQTRTALVIGNGGYAQAPLANAVNDAKDVATALKDAGFAVTLVTNADQKAMDEAVRKFGSELAGSKGVGLFYYSGHGVQIGGDNFLMPIGGEITHERDVKYRAVNMGQILDEMKAAGNGLNIVVLDACRNNPLESAGRGATRGLARVESGGGLFVSFSTSPGAVALDGQGRNSPYTKHLVSAIRTPGLALEGAFKQVLKGVYSETNGSQIPWVSSSFFGDFHFIGGPAGDPAPTPVAQVPPAQQHASAPAVQKSAQLSSGLANPVDVPALPGLYRVRGTNPNGSGYTGSLAITPAGNDTYKFTWWIASQVFRGQGRLDGRWLKVDWGSTSPVIYTVSASGALEGQWADGSASEDLSPHAGASADPGTDIAGNYTVTGSNPNGGRYSGRVTIAKGGGGYQVRWSIGNSGYKGTGKLDGGVFVVNWGQNTPAVYALGADGVLRGLWGAGTGEEILTPR